MIALDAFYLLDLVDGALDQSMLDDALARWVEILLSYSQIVLARVVA